LAIVSVAAGMLHVHSRTIGAEAILFGRSELRAFIGTNRRLGAQSSGGQRAGSADDGLGVMGGALPCAHEAGI